VHRGETHRRGALHQDENQSVFVSPGHKCDLEARFRFYCAATAVGKFPEPTRRAHNFVNVCDAAKPIPTTRKNEARFLRVEISIRVHEQGSPESKPVAARTRKPARVDETSLRNAKISFMISPQDHILFYGDSITDCGRSRDAPPGDSSGWGNGYVYQVAARLGADLAITTDLL
jgi:hypothetical protein